jgi:hypothetical protein
MNPKNGSCCLAHSGTKLENRNLTLSTCRAGQQTMNNAQPGEMVGGRLESSKICVRVTQSDTEALGGRWGHCRSGQDWTGQ